MRRDIEQAGVLQGSLNLVVGPDQRIIPVAADVLVELLVLLVLDLLGLTGPESGRGIYLLPLADLGIRLLGLLSLLRGLRGLDLPDLDRDADMVGVLLDDASDLPVVEELLLVILYMKDNRGAVLLLLDLLGGEGAGAVRHPAHALGLRIACGP